MKKFTKLLGIVLIIALVMSMGTTAAFAAATADSGKGGSASITITLPTDNAGTDEEITYTVYKVFDATNNGTSSAISYKINATNGALSDAMKTAGFLVDDGGNVHYGTFTADPDPLPEGQTAGTDFVGGVRGTITAKADLTEAALTAIAAYATDSIGTFKAKPSDGTLQITGLEYGYYYISTTTGTVVTVDSTNPNASVEDKNSIPGPPDKSITGVGDGSLDAAGENALAQVGTTVNFSVDIVKVKGATNYVFHDVMDSGLSYKNDVAVSVGGSAVTASSSINTEAENETFITTTATGDTITVSFDNDWLAALADSATITITYSATVTSDALTVNVAENTATLDYGDGHTTEGDTVKVYNAKFTVTKQDGEGKALAGAGFVIKNSAGKYYKYNAAAVPATEAQGTEGEEGYVPAKDAEPAGVIWVDSIDDATEYKSDAQGTVPAFKGLADGTYTLVEKTVPSGYNKAADSTFTIAAGDYTATNLEQTSTVVNNSGTELPSTGGIGTTIFYVVGSVLVIAAGILLITKKRMGRE